jgi:hypothetical protein
MMPAVKAQGLAQIDLILEMGKAEYVTDLSESAAIVWQAASATWHLRCSAVS